MTTRLRLTDIDLENMSIFVNWGKGGKDRVVPICSSLAESLARYLKDRSRLKKTCPELFTSLNRNSGLTESGIKRLVETSRKASGIHFGSHKLRHICSTNA